MATEVPISAITHEASMEALRIVGDRILDEARATAPRLTTAKRAGRGSFPRVPAGYLADHLNTDGATKWSRLLEAEVVRPLLGHRGH